jgi:hypothetical protein
MATAVVLVQRGVTDEPVKPKTIRAGHESRATTFSGRPTTMTGCKSDSPAGASKVRILRAGFLLPLPSSRREAASAPAVFAQDKMGKEGMAKDTMANDGMKKGEMKKDEMKK